MTTTRIQKLLETKKQIILYGPPGTGKTHNTKRIAVSLLDGLNYTDGSTEWDELSDTEPNAPKKAADSPLFNKMESLIKNLSGIEPEPSDTMIKYCSFSKRKKKKWVSSGSIIPRKAAFFEFICGKRQMTPSIHKK